MSLFVFTAQAVAGDGAGFPAGQRHAMLIFARAGTVEEAAGIAAERVSAEGWNAVALLRRKALSGETGDVADDVLRQAAESALADGCAFVVYRDPIPPDA